MAGENTVRVIAYKNKNFELEYSSFNALNEYIGVVLNWAQKVKGNVDSIKARLDGFVIKMVNGVLTTEEILLWCSYVCVLSVLEAIPSMSCTRTNIPCNVRINDKKGENILIAFDEFAMMLSSSNRERAKIDYLRQGGVVRA